MPTIQPMQAGALRRKITLLADAITSTADGFTSTPVTVLTTWGSVTVKPGNQLIAAIAGLAMAQTQYVITLRYPPSLTISPGMRVQDGAKTYRIHRVMDVSERHRTLQLMCLEEPAA